MPRPKPAPGESWVELNPRLTFYCPRALHAAIEREMVATGQTKSQVIVDRLLAGGLLAEEDAQTGV